MNPWPKATFDFQGGLKRGVLLEIFSFSSQIWLFGAFSFIIDIIMWVYNVSLYPYM